MSKITLMPMTPRCDWRPDYVDGLPSGRACGAVATHIIMWLDGSDRQLATRRAAAGSAYHADQRRPYIAHAAISAFERAIAIGVSP